MNLAALSCKLLFLKVSACSNSRLRIYRLITDESTYVYEKFYAFWRILLIFSSFSVLLNKHVLDCTKLLTKNMNQGWTKCNRLFKHSILSWFSWFSSKNTQWLSLILVQMRANVHLLTIKISLRFKLPESTLTFLF